jgi:hypothetical protein
MTCKECDKVDDSEFRTAWLRVGKANIGFIGCDDCLKNIFSKITGEDYSERTIVRVRDRRFGRIR